MAEFAGMMAGWHPTAVPWRTGKSVGRTIYACPPGSSYRDGEVLIGLMDTPELAKAAVAAHNLWISDCEAFGCHEQETGSIGDG